MAAGIRGEKRNSPDKPAALDKMEASRSEASIVKDAVCCRPKSDRLVRKMLEQIDRYKEKLFAAPVIVDTPNVRITVFPRWPS